MSIYLNQKMAKIPEELRNEMSNDPYYQRCAVTGLNHERIEWHHNLIFAGKQVQEKWCILPLLKSVHEKIESYKDKVDWIMLNRATDQELERYSKAINLKEKRDRLNKIYG